MQSDELATAERGIGLDALATDSFDECFGHHEPVYDGVAHLGVHRDTDVAEQRPRCRRPDR